MENGEYVEIRTVEDARNALSLIVVKHLKVAFHMGPIKIKFG